MNREKAIVRGIVFMLAGFLVLTSSGVASAGDEPLQGALIERECDAADIQKASGPAAERAPWIEALHQARERGDEAACRELEAQALKSPGSSETSGGTVLRPCTSTGWVRQLDPEGVNLPNQGNPPAPTGGSSGGAYGSDVKIGKGNPWTSETDVTMVSDWFGNLYVAWTDDFWPDNWIFIHRSTDGGNTWESFGGVTNYSWDVTQPSLAIGEGGNGYKLLVAYIVEDWNDIFYPEVMVVDLGTHEFDHYSVPIWDSWKRYQRPVIVTDSYEYSGWYAYLTCEGVFDFGTNNINTCTWRSTNGGANWGEAAAPFGDFDEDAWIDPDIDFGTTLDRVFLTSFNEDSNTIYTRSSDTLATSWNTAVPFVTLSTLPSHPVDPEIGAAKDHDHVMICCTVSYTGSDVIGQGYSTNAGNNWSTCWVLNGYTGNNEFAPALTASEGGGSWHLTFTTEETQSVHYSRRPQDLSTGWQAIPDTVDDLRYARVDGSYARKGIASNWSTDVACIAWSDDRFDAGGDTDVYADHGVNLGIMVDRCFIEEYSGGTIKFTLNAGAGNAFRSFILLGGVSGTIPGTPIPGGTVLPLNWDAFTDVVLELVNTSLFQNFMGQVNVNGMALATLNAPPVPGYGGLTMYYAFTLYNPFDHVSNAVAIPIVP
ncbi:MAG: hypothetical protein ACYTG7_09105 [Planctomycetota bacterium]|jgi:hypothetical protein